MPRPIVVDDRREPRQRRGGVVGRQQHAAPRKGRALFQMQVGDARAGSSSGKNSAPRRSQTARSPAIDDRRRRVRLPSSVRQCASLRPHGLFDHALPLPAEACRRPRRRTASLPISSMIGTASGEMRSSGLCTIRPRDARQHVAKPPDVEQAGRRVRARRLQQDVVGLVAAQHVVDQVGRDGHLPAALLLAGMAPLDQARRSPRSCGRCASACQLSASQASRSSPSMSSSNSSPSDGLPLSNIAPMSSERPDRERHSRWRRSRAASRPRAPAGGSAACRASGAPAGPRRDRRPCSGARRAERSRPAARRASAGSDLSACSAQPVAHLVRQLPSSARDRPACRAPARRDRSRAGTCRRHRTAPWRRRPARWRRSTRSRGCPRSAAPCRRRGRCRPATSVSRNSSSILPSAGPPRATSAPARARHSAR